MFINLYTRGNTQTIRLYEMKRSIIINDHRNTTFTVTLSAHFRVKGSDKTGQ